MLPPIALGMVAISGFAPSPLETFSPQLLAPYATHKMVQRAAMSDPASAAFDAEVAAFIGQPDAPFDVRLAVLTAIQPRTISPETAAAIEKALLGGAFATVKIGGQPADTLALAGYFSAITDRTKLTRASTLVAAAKARAPSSFGVGLVAALLDGHRAASRAPAWCSLWQSLRLPLYDPKLATDVGDAMLAHFAEIALSAREVCKR